MDIELGKYQYEYQSRIRSFWNDGNFELMTEIQNVKLKNEICETIDLVLDIPYNYNYLKIKNSTLPIPNYYVLDVQAISYEQKVYRLYLYPDVFSCNIAPNVKRMNVTKTRMTDKFHYPLNYRPYKYKKQLYKFINTDTSSVELGKENDLNFCIFSYTDNIEGVTTISYGWFQFSQKCVKATEGGFTDVGEMPSMADLLSGKFDELIGISADRIKGIWVLKSLNLVNRYITYAGNSRYILLTDNEYVIKNKVFAKFLNFEPIFQEFTLDTTISSNEYESIAFIDEYENILYTLPQGLSISKVRITLDLTPTTANLIFTFYNNSYPVSPQYLIASNDEKIGYQFAKPLVNISTTSNAWSEYNISGQRQMEISQIIAQRDFDKRNGYMNSISSGIGGGIAGATAGPIGAVVGLAVGLGGSLIINEYNDSRNRQLDNQLQEIKDKYYQNQSSNMILSSDSTLKALIPFEIMIAFLKPYDDEAQVILKKIQLEGYDTSIYIDTNNSDLAVIDFMTGYKGVIKCDYIEIKGLNIPYKYQEELRNYFLTGFYNESV